MKKFLAIIISILTLSFISLPAFADSPADISITLSPSTTGSVYICGGTSDNSCDGYNYLIVNINSGSSVRSYDSTITANFYDSSLGTIVNGRISASPLSDSLVLSLASSDMTSLYFTKPAWLSDGSVSIVLSTSQGCPACPTPEPCPEPVDAPYFVQLVIDAFWKYHTAFAGGAVAILAIFLVYRVIKGRLR